MNKKHSLCSRLQGSIPSQGHCGFITAVSSNNLSLPEHPPATALRFTISHSACEQKPPGISRTSFVTSHLFTAECLYQVSRRCHMDLLPSEPNPAARPPPLPTTTLGLHFTATGSPGSPLPWAWSTSSLGRHPLPASEAPPRPWFSPGILSDSLRGSSSDTCHHSPGIFSPWMISQRPCQQDSTLMTSTSATSPDPDLSPKPQPHISHIYLLI